MYIYVQFQQVRVKVQLRKHLLLLKKMKTMMTMMGILRLRKRVTMAKREMKRIRMRKLKRSTMKVNRTKSRSIHLYIKIFKFLCMSRN